MGIPAIVGTLIGATATSHAMNKANEAVAEATKAATAATAVSAPPSAVNVTSGKDSLDAAKNAKKKTAIARGFQNTIATSSQGDTSTATTSKKTLLGG